MMMLSIGDRYLDTDEQTKVGLKYEGGLFGIPDGDSLRSYDLSVPDTRVNRGIMELSGLSETEGMRRKVAATMQYQGVVMYGSLYLKRWASDRFELLFAVSRRQKYGMLYEPVGRVWIPADSIVVDKDDQLEQVRVPNFGWFDYSNSANRAGGSMVGSPPRVFPVSSLAYLISGPAAALGYTVQYLNGGTIYEDAGNYAVVLPTMNTHTWDTVTVNGNPINGFAYAIGSGSTLYQVGLSITARRYYRGWPKQNKTVYTFTALRDVRIRYTAQPGINKPVFVSGNGYEFLQMPEIGGSMDVTLQAGDWFTIASDQDGYDRWDNWTWKGPTGYGSNIPANTVFEISDAAPQAGIGSTVYLRDNLPDMSLAELLDAYCAITCSCWHVDEANGAIVVETFSHAKANAYLWKSLDNMPVTRKSSVFRYVSGYSRHNRVTCASASYVTETCRLMRDYPCDNDILEEESAFVTIPFNEGNWTEENGKKVARLEDVEFTWDPDLSVNDAEYSGELSIVFSDGTGGQALHLQQVEDDGAMGADFAELTYNAVSVTVTVICTMRDFCKLEPVSVVRWRGRSYIVKEASWGDGAAELELVRLPE